MRGSRWPRTPKLRRDAGDRSLEPDMRALPVQQFAQHEPQRLLVGPLRRSASPRPRHTGPPPTCTVRLASHVAIETRPLAHAEQPGTSSSRWNTCRPQRLRDAHHLVGTGRSATDTKHGVAAGDEAFGNGVKDLVEGIVSHVARAGQRHQRQRQPFADDGDVPGAKEWQRVALHRRSRSPSSSPDHHQCPNGTARRSESSTTVRPCWQSSSSAALVVQSHGLA